MSRPRKLVVNGPAVRDALVVAHANLPVRAVRGLWGQYATVRRLGWDEAEGEAWWGLLRAAGLYRPSKGEFSRYAFRWCRGAVLQAAKRLRQVRTVITDFSLGHPPGRDEWVVTVEERFGTLRQLVAGLPPCPERTYLEHHMAGATQYAAWAAAGKKYTAPDILHRKSIQLARCVAQNLNDEEPKPVEDRTIDNDLESIRKRCNQQRQVQPDYEQWDQTSLDRMWLLTELTRCRRQAGVHGYHTRRKAAAEVSSPTAAHRQAVAQGYTGDICEHCGECRMKRNGACLVCDNCGTSGGCS